MIFNLSEVIYDKYLFKKVILEAYVKHSMFHCVSHCIITTKEESDDEGEGEAGIPPQHEKVAFTSYASFLPTRMCGCGTQKFTTVLMNTIIDSSLFARKWVFFGFTQKSQTLFFMLNHHHLRHPHNNMVYM